MGGLASKDAGTAAEPLDPRFLARAWREGVPFTLLNDQGYVLDKTQELAMASQLSAATAAALKGSTRDVTASGLDEASLEEMQQAADRMRTKLFGHATRLESGEVPVNGEKAEGSPRGRTESGNPAAAEPSSSYLDRENAASALEGMKGNPLSRESPLSVANEHLRVERAELVHHYFAQLAAHVRASTTEASTSSSTAATATDGHAYEVTPPLSTLLVPASPGIVSRANAAVSHDASPLSMFSLSSFRLQLEMLREYRVLSPRLFETGAMAIVSTVLDFPPFVLHEITPGSAEDVLLRDMHKFCRDLLKESAGTNAPLVEPQQQVVLLLLLALGVTSGRVTLLLEFVEGMLETVNASGEGLKDVILQGHSFHAWVNTFVDRLMQYRLHFGIGTFEDATIVNQVPVKELPSQDKNETSEVLQNAIASSCVAADGNYLYTWNTVKGLAKVGTGLNFTVAGKVYAEATPGQFVDIFRPKYEYRALVYGLESGTVDVSSIVREDVAGSGNRMAKVVHDIFADRSIGAGSSDASQPKLFVAFSSGNHEEFRVFDDKDVFDASALQSSEVPVDGGASKSIQIICARYGEFDVLSDAALTDLRAQISNNAGDTEKEGDSRLELTSEILESLRSHSPVSLANDREIVAVYADSFGGLGAQTLLVGDRIAWAEGEEQQPFSSSLVVCDDSLFLSLVYRGFNGSGLLPPSLSRKRRAQKLLRVNTDNLQMAETVLLPSSCDSETFAVDGSEQTSRVLAYITEGKLLYQITSNPDGLVVRVLAPKLNKSAIYELSVVRSYTLGLKASMGCSVVSGRVDSLKSFNADGSDSGVSLPSFYTNGVSIGMITRDSSADNTAPSKAKIRTHCMLFDCQDGHYNSVETAGTDSTSAGNTQTEQKSASKLFCFERAIPSTSVCFDGKNNLIWLFNGFKGGLHSFQNTGHQICMNERSIPLDQLHKEISVGATSFAERTCLNVLGSLYRTAEESGPRGKAASAKTSSSNDSASSAVPFVADFESSGLQTLLNLCMRFATAFKANSATSVQVYCLQACLGSLSANVDYLLDSSDGARKDTALAVLREGLKRPLDVLLQLSRGEDDISDDDNQGSDSVLAPEAENNRVGVLAVALDLYTSSMRVFHGDVNEHLAHILKYLRRWEQGKASSTEFDIVTRLLVHVSTRVGALYQSMTRGSGTFDQFMKIIEFAVELQKKQLRAASSGDSSLAWSSSVPAREAASALVALVNSMTQLVFLAGTEDPASNSEAINVALTVYQVIGDACCSLVDDAANHLGDSNGATELDRVDKTLKTGFVGILSPVVLAFGMQLLRHPEILASLGDHINPQAGILSSNGAKSAGASTNENGDGNTPSKSNLDSPLLALIKNEATKMRTLGTSLSRLVGKVDPKQQEFETESISMITKVETWESAHEYDNNLHSTTELRIPGAIRMVITFDPKTRTENNYDYVTFYKDQAQTEYYGNEKYSGRDSDQNWPGLDNNPPLIIDSDHCFVLFHTDNSNTDWGFKLTAVGEILEKKKFVQQHWMSFLLDSTYQALDETIKLLIDGSLFSPIEDVEISNDHFLQSDLLKSGVCSEENKNGKVLQLLQDFITPQEGSDAARLVSALSDRSAGRLRPALVRSTSFNEMAASVTNNSVNSAVRAAAAAILHHNMWGMDAFAFTENLRDDISEQVLRGWKNAQKMRDWFYLGDAAEGSVHTQSPPHQRSLRLRRQPSAFKGMSEDSLKILCDNVIERAKFLLELTPASFAFVTGAKRRWNLLAKYGNAIRKLNPADSPLEKWYNLLDEVHAATELRSLFQYRRTSSERLRSGQNKSVTEQVLEFIQSDVDVSEIRKVIALRNQRAMSRAAGLSLFSDVLSGVTDSKFQNVMIESFAATLQKMAYGFLLAVADSSTGDATASSIAKESIGSPRIHLDVGLLGSDELFRQQVSDGLGKCLGLFSKLLNGVPSKDNAAQSSLVVAILKSCAIDYELEDSWLLHESRILSQIFRLLSSESIGIRRSAQSVLAILLSRFVVGKAGAALESPQAHAARLDKHDAAAFQRQLFAAVGLQLEGAVSQVYSADDDSTSKALSPYWHLPDNSPGLTAPCTQDTRVRWNHTIMLWAYVSRIGSLYALKSGDEVRRGPDWTSEGDASDDSDTPEVGTVLDIVSPTIVLVKWGDKTTESRFDPKQGIYDVVSVDEELGGAIYFKGNSNLSKDGSVSEPPWSYFGLFLGNDRQLIYKIARGAEKPIEYETSYILDFDDWAHIAVVQHESTLRIFVNGSMASQHVLEPFLVMGENTKPSECEIIESVHPFADSQDLYWPVHIPGAKRIRVTFDPLCDVDGSSGYVRLYKDSRCDEYWGEAKYSGKYSDPERNFPGALSNRSRRQRLGSSDGAAVMTKNVDYVEVPADSFLVYFHNEGSSSGWGFRLLALPEYFELEGGDESLEIDLASKPSLNPYPFYFGEPPTRALDVPAANAWVYEPKVLAYPISENDLVSEVQVSCPQTDTSPVGISTDRILYILGLIRSCAETQFSREQVGTPDNIGNLMVLALYDQLSIDVRSASLRVLRDLAGFMTPAVVDAQFDRVFPGKRQSFLQFVFASLSDGLNVWRNYCENMEAATPSESESVDGHNPDSSRLHLRTSAQGQVSLIAAYVSLLRALAESSEWNAALVRLMADSTQAIDQFYLRKEEPSHDAIGAALATFALLGGNYNGVYLGGRVRCCVFIDGKETIESGYLIQFRMKNRTPSARVLFDCDPTKGITLPLSDIAHIDDDEQVELKRFLRCMEPAASDLLLIYSRMLHHDEEELFGANTYQAKSTKKESVEIVESEHPYAPDENATYSLKFPGASEIVIRFDKMSSINGPSDYVQFRKRSSDGANDQGGDENEYWGEEKYYGVGDGFPGVGSTPVLRIPANEVDVHFHTETATGAPGSDWGFKLNACAYEPVVSYPPEVAPPITTSALSDMRARCVKSLGLMFQDKQMGDSSIPGFSTLLPSLVKFANAPSFGHPTQSSAKTQVFESKHPYSNSVVEYMTVSFSGASKLEIVFDSKCRTEQGCDYVTFFKDKSLTERWGAFQYSGVESGANWPGADGRPSLVIPNDSFTLLWFTDASNVDWGWKFTVTAEFSSRLPIDHRLDQLDNRAYHVFEALYEKMDIQRVPSAGEFEDFDKFANGREAQRHALAQEPTRKLLALAKTARDSSTSSGDEAQTVANQLQFQVVDTDGVTVRKSRDPESEGVAEWAKQHEFTAAAVEQGWIKVSVTSDDDSAEQQEGWVCRRTGDRVHVANIGSSARSEELLTLGIDDQSFEPKHSNFELDENNSDHDRMATFCSPFAYDGLSGQMTRLQSLAYDTHHAMTTKAARKALLTYLSCNPESASARWADIGGPEEAFILFSHFFVEEEGRGVFDNRSHTLELLSSRLRSMLTDPKDDAATGLVLGCCFDLIKAGVNMVPKGRGAMRVMESTHPYLDNMDQYWQLSIPGAKKIKVVFDRQSKTESGCDYLCFYKEGSNRIETIGPAQIGGRGGSENWPGCGDQPPLYIDGDSCEVYFHSDSSQNDWGFKLYAIGIFEAEAPAPCFESEGVDETKSAKVGELAVGLLSMSFWFLSVLASTPIEHLALGSAARNALCSPDMTQALIMCLETMPQRIKMHGLQVITAISQGSMFHQMPVAQVEMLRDLLIQKLRAQHLAEERVEAKSPYLQALVDCAASFELAVDSHCFDSLARLNVSRTASASPSWKPVEFGADAHQFWLSEPSSPTNGLIQFRLLFHDVAGPVTFGLMDSRGDNSGSAVNGAEPVFAIKWSDDGQLWVDGEAQTVRSTMGQRIMPGDAVTFQLDLLHQTLTYSKNNVLAVTIAARQGHGAAVSWGKLPFDRSAPEAVRLGVRTESHAQTRVEFEVFEHSPLALLPSLVVPSWYNKVVETMGMLLDFTEDRASKMVTKETVHPLPPLTQEKTSSDTERVEIQGAIALEIVFDRHTVVGDDDSLVFSYGPNNGEDKQSITLTGLNGDKRMTDRPSLFTGDPSQSVSHVLHVGDSVVRSMDWEYGDEDGGPGCVGVVQELTSWGGHSGTAVRVKWNSNDTESLYRYGFRGAFDVHKRQSPHDQDPPLVIPGDAFSFEYRRSNASVGTASSATLPLELVDRVFEGSLRLDSTSKLELSLDSSSTLLSDLTLELWVCVDTPSASNSPGFTDPSDPSQTLSHLEVLRILSADEQAALSLLVDHTGRCALAQLPKTGGDLLHQILVDTKAQTTSGTLQFGTWVHLAVVLAGSTASVHQNGRLIWSKSGRTDRECMTLGSGSRVVFGTCGHGDGMCAPLSGHLYDIRLWDVPFKTEQLRSHVVGLESVESSESQGSSRPGTPSRGPVARTVALGSPRSSLSSPRSPSSRTSFVIPPHMKQWVTINRSTTRDLATVRLNRCVRPETVPDLSTRPTFVYYEAHALSGGKLCVGWTLEGMSLVDARSSMIGESPNSFGVEPARKLAHLSGSTQTLEPFTPSADTAIGSSGFSSPRKSEGNAGAFHNDIFSRPGDVIGCAVRLDTKEVLFFVNGDLVARTSSTVPAASTVDVDVGEPFVDPDTGRDFDDLVDEMVSMGLSRQASTDALTASGGGNVPSAVDWLLNSTSDSKSRNASADDASAMRSPLVSPRARSRSQSEASRKSTTTVSHSVLGGHTGFIPTASLGAQGAQGLAWNFGQRPFKFEPTFEGHVDGEAKDISVLSVLQAANCEEDALFFEVFDLAEDQWERVVYRHRLHDVTPRLTGWWKLNEGSGVAVEDASGSEQSGAIVSVSTTSQEEKWWDVDCEPPAAAKRRNDESPGLASAPFFSTENGAKPPVVAKALWGYRFYVIPHFSAASIGRRRFQSPAIRFGDPVTMGLQARHDRQLIKYVNKVAQAKQLTATQVLRANWSELAPDSEELVRWPVLVEMATGVTPSAQVEGAVGGADDSNDAGAGVNMSASARVELHERLARRFKLLQEFNSAVSRVLPLVQFGSERDGGQRLGELVAVQRFRVLSAVKRGVWEAALGRTAASTSVTVELTLNRPKAMRHRSSGAVDTDVRNTLFSQAFRQLNALDGANFRRADNLYHVTFLGENAQDAGGPYRETLTQYCDELESAQLPLLLPSSNAQHNVGAGRDRWVLNPGAPLTSPTMAQLLEFLGKLLGASMRSKHYLSLHLAALVWKPLVGERVTLDDLAQADSMVVNSMRKMRTIDRLGVTEELFEDIVMEVFTTLSADNRAVELLPGGASRAVTFATRGEYADLVEQYRLHEGDAAAACVRRGLAKVVPAKLLALFTGAELEVMVCGTPEVDVELLRRCTEYSGCSPHDQHVEWFWSVLGDFSHEERSAFLRFVWGRARLPAHEKEFPQRFKLQSFSVPAASGSAAGRRRGIDDFLPVSHTCFFALELPSYTSEVVVRDKLRYAIYNCQEIDGDGDSVAANQLAWEE